MGRKRNPQYPKINLEQAIEKGFALHLVANEHTISMDVAAQELGYTNSRSGAAQTTLASLKSFHILEFEGKGKVSISPNIKVLKFSPNTDEKSKVLNELLLNPPIYNQLFSKFGPDLASNTILVWELMQAGFKDETAANQAVKTFKESINYIKSIGNASLSEPESDTNGDDKHQQATLTETPESESLPETDEKSCDRILIRLPEGRKAWIIVPDDFQAKDKPVLIKQIEAIYVEEE
jgi:hypothetical protein